LDKNNDTRTMKAVGGHYVYKLEKDGNGLEQLKVTMPIKNQSEENKEKTETNKQCFVLTERLHLIGKNVETGKDEEDTAKSSRAKRKTTKAATNAGTSNNQEEKETSLPKVKRYIIIVHDPLSKNYTIEEGKKRRRDQDKFTQ
ncbi:unnamed protein product, partial [Didymodactylos carnosus]